MNYFLPCLACLCCCGKFQLRTTHTAVFGVPQKPARSFCNTKGTITGEYQHNEKGEVIITEEAGSYLQTSYYKQMMFLKGKLRPDASKIWHLGNRSFSN